MDRFLIASCVGALALGVVALAFWLRARALERSTERLIERISRDIDQLVLRTLREQGRPPGGHAPQQEPFPGHPLGRGVDQAGSLSRAA